MCRRWWSTRGASPGPATVELDFQREAQERPDDDDQPKNSDILERGLDGDGTDDVGGHQELQPEQDAACEDGSDGPVDAPRTVASEQAECSAHQGCRQAHEDGRDAEDLHAPPYVIHGLLEAHLLLQSRGLGVPFRVIRWQLTGYPLSMQSATDPRW